MPVHANQTSFKKGKSGNPNGRPIRGYSISDMVKEMLNNDLNSKKEIGLKILEKAKEGDMVAIKTLWQYMDGMPQQDITSGGEKLNSFGEAQIDRIADRIAGRKRSDGDTSSS